MMKRISILIIVAALGWSGYWLWGQRTLLSAYEGWFAKARAEGWVAAYDDVAVRGFPNRHDTTWTGLELRDPDSGWGWQAPFFQLFLLSYDWHHAIAVWPERQVIVTPDGPVEVGSDKMQASLVTEGASQVLERANLVADVLNLRGSQGTTALAQLRASLARAEGADYDLAVAAEDLALPAGVVQATGGALPGTFRTARLRARIGLDGAWALAAPERRPSIKRIAVELAELEWGPMALRMTGELDIDAQGRATGEVHLDAQDWREMLAVAKASGQLAQPVVDGLETALTLIAQMSGRGDALDVTLRLEDGRMFLGPLPLGEAPRIVLP